MRKLTEHVISKGYKRIAYISGPKQVTIGKQRLEGSLEVMSNFQITINDEYIIENGFNEKGGRNAMNKLLTLPTKNRADAVVCVNDLVAFGAMEAIRENGLKITENIGIIGFTNDVRSGLVTPKLTTVHQPAYEVGKRAAEKVIRNIENKEEPIEYVELATRLIVRESC